MTHAAKTQSQPFEREPWLASVLPDRREEALRLLDLFGDVTGWEPRLWGPSMVGFGRYAYRYESGHEGQSMATGFAPRKADLSIYILPGYADFGPILSRLGPHRTGKACLYLRRLRDADLVPLADLIRAGLDDLTSRWPVHPV